MISAVTLSIFAFGCHIETSSTVEAGQRHEAIAPFGSTGHFCQKIGKDGLPILVGPTTAKDILKHRPEFQEVYEKTHIPPELSQKWQAISKPCSILVAFGSWCEDSHRWVPPLIKLAESGNPLISLYWIGTDRAKKSKKGDWPPQTKKQIIRKVPTVWLFAPVPGGKTKMVGRIVENSPKPGQTMAEAVVELLDSIR